MNVNFAIIICCYLVGLLPPLYGQIASLEPQKLHSEFIACSDQESASISMDINRFSPLFQQEIQKNLQLNLRINQQIVDCLQNSILEAKQKKICKAKIDHLQQIAAQHFDPMIINLALSHTTYLPQYQILHYNLEADILTDEFQRPLSLITLGYVLNFNLQHEVFDLTTLGLLHSNLAKDISYDLLANIEPSSSPRPLEGSKDYRYLIGPMLEEVNESLGHFTLATNGEGEGTQVALLEFMKQQRQKHLQAYLKILAQNPFLAYLKSAHPDTKELLFAAQQLLSNNQRINDFAHDQLGKLTTADLGPLLAIFKRDANFLLAAHPEFCPLAQQLVSSSQEEELLLSIGMLAGVVGGTLGCYRATTIKHRPWAQGLCLLTFGLLLNSYFVWDSWENYHLDYARNFFYYHNHFAQVDDIDALWLKKIFLWVGIGLLPIGKSLHHTSCVERIVCHAKFKEF